MILIPRNTGRFFREQCKWQLPVVEEVEVAITANLTRAERLRQAILKKAFAGELAPQNPDDEPASVLLERIKGERDGQRKLPGV